MMISLTATGWELLSNLFLWNKIASNKHRSQLRLLAVPLNDAVIPLMMMLLVEELLQIQKLKRL